MCRMQVGKTLSLVCISGGTSTNVSNKALYTVYLSSQVFDGQDGSATIDVQNAGLYFKQKKKLSLTQMLACCVE